MKQFSVSTPKNIILDKLLFHSVLSDLKKSLEFSIKSLNLNFIESDMMIEINTEYLGHNYDTDIITFSYSEDKTNLDGEIFISIDQAIENAVRYNVHLDSEIIRLIVHGILHLLGFNDKDPKDKRRMKREENRLTNSLSKKYENFVIEYDYQSC